MKRKRQTQIGILSAFGMLLLILDAKTVLSGAKNGIEMCLFTVVPALFPFIVLSQPLNNSLLGQRITLLEPVRKLCRIPKGAESLFLLGILGGYPVGAQCIGQAYRNGKIHRNDAERLLAFCNNAGPSFIFGILGSMFTSLRIPWLIWMTHILSAITVGMILPAKKSGECIIEKPKPITLNSALERGIRIMGSICGWVILFKICLCFFDHWVMRLFPSEVKYILYGFTELANGCWLLTSLKSESLRFVLCNCFLSFGGLCVIMQTSSVTPGLEKRVFLQGKMLHCIISFIFSSFLQYLIFPDCQIALFHISIAVTIVLLCILILRHTIIKNYGRNLSTHDV